MLTFIPYKHPPIFLARNSYSLLITPHPGDTV